jgi:hypothetical protein
MPKDFHARATAKKRAARVRMEYATGQFNDERISTTDHLAQAGAKLTVRNGTVVSRRSKNKKTSSVKHQSQTHLIPCPKCPNQLNPSNVARHLSLVHGISPNNYSLESLKSSNTPAIPKTPVSKNNDSSLVLNPQVVSLKPLPPEPNESLPIIVRCAVCRQHVKYSGLLVHYIQAHYRELPAFTDESCLVNK